MFHNLLFLGPGGRTVFQGGVDEADEYFAKLGFEKPKNVNPADFYMDVIGGVYENEGFDQNQLFQEYRQYQLQRDGVKSGVINQNEGVVNDDVNVDIVDGKVRKQSERDSQNIDSVELRSFKRTGENDEKQYQIHRSCQSGEFGLIWNHLKRNLSTVFKHDHGSSCNNFVNVSKIRFLMWVK